MGAVGFFVIKLSLFNLKKKKSLSCHMDSKPQEHVYIFAERLMEEMLNECDTSYSRG